MAHCSVYDARPVRPLFILLFILLVASSAYAFGSGCSPTSHAPERKVVIPEPPLATEGQEAEGNIGVRAIFVAWTGAKGAPSDLVRTKAEADARAKRVASVAGMSGEHFVELVLKYSDRPPIKDGGGPGALLERGSGMLPQAAERIAFLLGVGAVSDAIETEQGYVIVQRTETPIGGPEAIGARHILIAYKGAQRADASITRTRDEAKALAQQVLTELRAGKSWDELWKAHSNEPGGQASGSLGLFGRGQMVPEFERAAFEMKVGQVSEPIETPFGFHVIERTK